MVTTKIKLRWWKKIYYPIWRKWDWAIHIPQEAKWFIQRGKNGFADCDVWSIDGYLCSWLPSALEKLKKSKRGCPVWDKCDCTKSDEKKKCLFESYLDKMILGFKSAEDIGELNFMTKKNKNKPEVWKEEQKKLEKKFDEGMELLHKHFFGLWD